MNAFAALGLLWGTTNYQVPGRLFLPYGARPADMTKLSQGSHSGTVNYTVPAGQVAVIESIFEDTAAIAASFTTVGSVNVYKNAGTTGQINLAHTPIFVSAGIVVALPVGTFISGFTVPADTRITPKVVSIVQGVGYTVTTGKRLIICGATGASALGQLLVATLQVGSILAAYNTPIQLGFPALAADLVDFSNAGNSVTIWGYEVSS